MKQEIDRHPGSGEIWFRELPELKGMKVTVAALYPNTYRAGMASLGYQVLLDALISLPGVGVERAFAVDRSKTETLGKSFETGKNLKSFDIIAISLSFENDLLNIVKTLKAAGINPVASERSAKDPLIVLGGIVTFMNPVAFSSVSDVIFVGEIEAGGVEMFTTLARNVPKGRAKALEAVAGTDGVYIPSIDRDTKPGTVKRMKFDDLAHQTRATSSIAIAPESEFGRMGLVELTRGCPMGCRFCASGFIYREPRQFSADAILDSCNEILEHTGTVGLISSTATDHPQVLDICRGILNGGKKFSLASLRLDKLEPEIIDLLAASGQKTLTLAPEVASERLRKKLNKFYEDSIAFEVADLANKAGIKKLKLYFMVGLPSERNSDINAISKLVLNMWKIFSKSGKKHLMEVSINPFIPKPWTPFQHDLMLDIMEINKRVKIIAEALEQYKNVSVSSFSPFEAALEALIIRSGAELSTEIIRLVQDGLGPRGILRVMSEELENLVMKPQNPYINHPWDIVDQGIAKDFLSREWRKSQHGDLTDECDTSKCRACGVC